MVMPIERRCTVANVLAPVRLTVARWLESGSLSVPLTRAIARAHGLVAGRAVARPLHVPIRDGSRPLTVTVGGATLGGSGKTRVAIACARELAACGARVALIGHAYRARARRARVVLASDTLEDVGDEALLCAQALAGVEGALVVVGPSRQAAVDHAVSLGPAVDALVIDGPLQLAPVRSSLALLALDAKSPWGSDALPPAGDLRAPRKALLAAADQVVEVDATPAGAWLDGRSVPLADLAASRSGLRLGLFTALARPDRLERALFAAGVAPEVVVRAPDHGPVTPSVARRLDRAGVDLWLATGKCALHLEALHEAGAELRVAILDGQLALPPRILLALRAAWEPPPHCVA